MRDLFHCCIFAFGVIIFILLIISMINDYQVFHECRSYGFDDGTGKIFASGYWYDSCHSRTEMPRRTKNNGATK